MLELLARIRSFWRGIRRPDRLEAEMDEEMRFHLEMEAERLVRERGLAPEEALRQASIAFGGVEKRKEEGRDVRGLGWVMGMSLDFRLGLRMMRKHPGLTVVGGLGLALATAVAAGFFSFLSTMADPALPLEDGERIVAIQNMDVARGEHARHTQLHDLSVWQAELRAIEELGAYRTVERNLITPGGRAEPLRVAEMTGSGFRVARVPALRGRHLLDEDEREDAPPVVVIGYDVWQGRFAGSPEVVGQTLRLGAVTYTVVGVMPEGFAFPVNNRLWAPLRLDPTDYARGEAPPVDVFGRLAPGTSLEQAQAQLATIGRGIAAANPVTHEHIRPRVLPYARAFLDSPELTWVFHLLQLLVSLLLVVIAVNVAVLVYARTAMRAGEIAVRLALGASRARVVAQLFVEALVLSGTAAAVGLIAAAVALDQVNAYAATVTGQELPFWWDMGLSPATVLYTATLAVLAAVIVGVIPGLQATSRRIQADLRGAAGASMRMGRAWTAMIVAQVAVAVAVLPATAMFAWSEVFPQGIQAQRFEVGTLMSAELRLDEEVPPTPAADEKRRELAARLEDRQREVISRLQAEPGVEAVTYASTVSSGSIEIENARAGAEPTHHGARLVQVGPGLFEVFGASVLAGRTFVPADLSGTTQAAVVNRSFVDQVLPGGEALGRRFRYTWTNADLRAGEGDTGEWYEIVGVVEDLPVELPYRWQGVPTLYHVAEPNRLNPMSLVVRTRGISPQRFTGRLRELVTAIDPTLRLGEVRSVASRIRDEERTRRQITIAIVIVAFSVVLLSAAGIHALMAFTVVRRRREIGIRSALGAQPRRILASVFARAAGQLATGAAIGGLVGGAVIVMGDHTPREAAALLLGVAALMITVGLVAAIGPARRGLRIQPMEALREE